MTAAHLYSIFMYSKNKLAGTYWTRAISSKKPVQKAVRITAMPTTFLFLQQQEAIMHMRRQQARQDIINLALTFLLGVVVVYMSFPVMRFVA